MIRYVKFSSESIRAGEFILLHIDASYPVSIEIKCFVTQPPPTRFVPCPQSGRHTLHLKEPFNFLTNVSTFQNGGHVEFKITDSEYDIRVYEIKVKGLNTPLAGTI